MIILGIETSCDETAAAIVENGTKIISSVVASSQEIYKQYGGIIPEQAAREQIRSIMPVINETMKQSSHETIDAIAVTIGPGLIGSLLIGVETAKTLAWLWQKPIIPVNHLIAHIYANFINNNLAMKQLDNGTIFPSLCLIVSGGHTELLLMKNHGQFHWLGGTRDDAAGECFDKCARLLGLGYPGGPAIAATAAKLQIPNPKFPKNNEAMKKIKLPRPMLDQDNFDFSFSGLKTAVIDLKKTIKQWSPTKILDASLGLSSRVSLRNFSGASNEAMKQLAYEIQEAITDVLVQKTLKAAQKFKVKTILVGGGVAANSRLREKFNKTMKQWSPTKILDASLGLSSRVSLRNSSGASHEAMKLFIPPPSLCTDNGTFVASAAYFNYSPTAWSKVKANPSLIMS